MECEQLLNCDFLVSLLKKSKAKAHFSSVPAASRKLVPPRERYTVGTTGGLLHMLGTQPVEFQ